MAVLGTASRKPGHPATRGTSGRLASGLGLALLLGTACGTQGNPDPLPDTWPRAPLRGFALRDTDQPYTLLRLGWNLDQPAVAPRADDPAVPLSIWGRMDPRQMATQQTLFCASVTDLGADVPPPDQPALSPTAAWEGASLSSPAWLDGDDDLPALLFYQGSDGSIGLAKGVGDCAVARLTTAAPLLAASALTSGQVGRISALRTGAQVRLYYLVDGQQAYFAQTDVATLQRFAAGEPVTPSFTISPPLLAATDFQVQLTAVNTLVAERLDELYVRRVTTPVGRDRFDLYAVATAMTTSVIVSAASYSGGTLGVASDRFLPVESSVLDAAGGTPISPTMITYNARPLMLLGYKTVQTGIAAALQPSPQ